MNFVEAAIYGVKVIESEQAMVQAVELWDSTKEFCSPEFTRQFNDWSLATFGKKPGAYYINYGGIAREETVLLVHPAISGEIKDRFRQAAETEALGIFA